MAKETAFRSIKKLEAQDALFLHSETQDMGMHTMGTLLLDPTDAPGGRYGHEEIVETIASHLHLMPPLRQRLLPIPGGFGHPMMVDDPDFELENHVHRIGVPEPGTLLELAEVVGDIASRPLLRSQPLWEMWVVDGLEGGRLALVMKLHHSTLDGATGSAMMGSLMDLSADAGPPQPPAQPFDPPPLPSALELVARSVGSNPFGPLWLGNLVFATARGLLARKRALDEVTPEGEEAPPLFGGGPMTVFNRAITTRRTVAYGSAPLEDVKRIKRAFGVTVNDVVLAAAALSLRRYLQAEAELPDQPLLSLVPVSTKSEAEKEDFSNKVSSLIIKLPTHLASPAEMLDFVHRETANAKVVFSAVEDDIMPEWLKLLPPPAIAALAQIFAEWKLADDMTSPIANVVVSNMMGPPVPLFFGGARVEAVFPMGPVAHGLGLNLTVLSNMGRLDIGVLACPHTVADVWAITEGFSHAVGELKIAAEKLGQAG